MKSMRDETADRQIDSMLSRALTQQADPDAALQRRICHAFLSTGTRDTMEEWTKRQVGLVCICVNVFVNDVDMKSGHSLRLKREHASYLIFPGNIWKWNKFLQNCKI